MADFTLEAGLKAKASDIQTFVREIQGQLNNKHRVSIPFAPDQKSMADFAKKLQDEINKQSVSVKVKVDYGDKGSSGGASGEKKKAEEAANSYAKLTNAIRDYYAQTAKMTKGAGSEEFSIIEKRVESARTEMDRLNVSVEDLAVHFADGSIKDYLKNVEGLNLSEKQLDTVTKAVADGLQKVAKANDEVASKTKEQANADKDAADAANNRAKEINKLTNSISSFIKSFIGIASVTQLVKSLYNNVVDLDKAVVDLQIATGYDRSTVSNMVKQYSKLGQQLGVTTVDVTKAADSWLRQGYEAEQATTLITASTMLAKLGQLDMSAATDYLTSTMKGYGIAVNDVVSIVDKLSAVDLVSATSSGDLAEAMQKTAVTANQTGIPLEKLIGMLATISEVSQQSASTVGTAMKSMLARMVNIKAGMLADPETGEDLSNVEAALRGVGIALRDTNGDFRNLDSVLEETAAKWQTLTGVQRNAIAVALGGTRQQENVRILMEYWDQVVNLTNVATNSAGTAQEKFEAYSNSVEAKINALKAAWQSLSDTILSSDFIKGVVDVLTVIVNALDALGGKVTVIAGILGIFANKIYKTGFNTALNGGATWLGSVHAGLSNISSVLGKIVNFLFVAHPVATAIVAAIGAIGYGIYKYNKYIDDAPARVKETNEEISKQKDRYTEVTDEIKKLQEEGKKDGFNDNIKSQIILLQQEKEELEEVIHKLEEANKAANQQAIENANRSYDNYARNTYYAYSGGIENTIATGAVSDLAKRIRKEEEYLELMSDPQWDIVFDIMSGATYGDFITGSAHMSLDDMSDGAKAALANFLGTDVDPDNIMMVINAFREYYEQYSGDMKVLERIYNDLLEFRQNDFLEDGRKAEIDSLLSDTIFDRFRENAESNADAVEAAKKRIKKAYSFRSNNSSVETKAEKEAAEAAKRIMDVRMAVYAEESRKQLADLLRGTYDKIDGKTFEDVATPYDDEWYARYFPDFAKQRDELIELYPELEKYFELWGKGLMSGSDLADKIDEVISAAERASNKDVFSAVENLFNADWSGDKEKAISELEKVALAFGVDSGTWGIFEEILKTSNLKTDKNSLLDMMINFLDGSTIEGAAELAKHLKDIKDAVAAPENKTETIWTQFENAVKAFDNASDLNEQTKAIADMIDALAKMPDVPEDVFDNVLGMILALKRHDLSLEDFKDAIYDIAQQYPVIRFEQPEAYQR